VAAILEFDGKRVLDVGCGFGCNLLSAQGRAAATFGVDLEPSYLQLGPILAERAGLAVPQVARADAASLPLASQHFDMVLCASVIQYVDPRPALREAHRVLRPGGELVLFAATFGQMLRAHLRSARWRDVAWAAHHLRMALNTLALQLTGRRLLGGGSHTTAAPVHPTRRHHLRLLETAGLRVRDAVDMAGRGILFHAVRPEA
jgi:ubiquinone/menaquinone biosynthesis C-methylase UbiE